MKKHPVIGISGSHNAADCQFYIRENYMESVLRAGGVPVLLPEIADEETAEALLDSIDGLLLAGGVDILPARYGEQTLPACGEVDEKRDVFELLITPMAIARRMPVFGICRGIQTLAVVLGGTLIQDIESQRGIPAIVHQQKPPYNAATHEVRFVSGGLLERIVGSASMPVNSMHHQAIKDAGEHLRIEGMAEDGIIEAVSYIEDERVFGVQFHPEYLSAESEQAAKLFRYFVEQAAAYQR